MEIKAFIGLGNPGPQFFGTRHNIGFAIIDNLSDRYGACWVKKDIMEIAEISINDKKIFLIKPLTYMNSSGKVLPFLTKKGIHADNIVVIHDELELPFGVIKYKIGGSAKGHNGLKSIIAGIGDGFHRLRFGIGRPDNRDDVPEYVLKKFSENNQILEQKIDQAVDELVSHFL